LIIEESEESALQGWTCRGCGHINKVTLAGQIVSVANDPVEPAAATADASPALSMANDERRQHLRVHLTSPPVFGRRVNGLETFTVEEASPCGFSMMSRSTFLPGTSYQFRMWAATKQVTVVAAVCRSCRVVECQDGPWMYRVGFQFLPQSGRRLGALLAAIASNMRDPTGAAQTAERGSD
jgi:hypothetical protein